MVASPTPESGAAKLVWLNVLNMSTRNCSLIRSVMSNDFESDESSCCWPSANRGLMPEFPYVWATVSSTKHAGLNHILGVGLEIAPSQMRLARLPWPLFSRLTPEVT